LEPIIDKYNGFIDKYIGDAVMALFPTGADDAVQAAIAMLKQLVNYNQGRQCASYPPIQIGIGLHTGPLMLGTVGGHNRMDGTVISDAVNLASRVEGLTKTYGASLLITEQTYQQLRDVSQYNIRVIDSVNVKGKTESVTVYEVFDADSELKLKRKSETLPEFEQGFLCFHQEKFDKAIVFFEKVLAVNETDFAAQIYLNHCQKILSRVPQTPRILIVDDTPFSAVVLSHLLTNNNFEVSTVQSGENALNMVKHNRPHLILLDVMMPGGIDGYETCRRLKAEPQTRDIPIILMSSLTDTVDKVKGFKAGAVDYVTKPFQYEEILARIKTHLNEVYRAANVK